MPVDPEVMPLPLRQRRLTFLLLVGLFICVLPFLFLYAAGYRFSLSDDTVFISTGGLYVASEKTGAAIYIDDELVRETRAFRRAFYAQGLEPGTHRVHVQMDNHHTWVKELPVYPHLVTEAQAFNLPLIPRARVVSPWRNSAGETVLFASSTLAYAAINAVVISTTTATRAYIPDTEYASLLQLFEERPEQSLRSSTPASSVFPNATSSVDTATSTQISNGVRLVEDGADIYAEWIGQREQMPYYYCAEEFELTGGATSSAPLGVNAFKASSPEAALLGPVQDVPEDAVCDPRILIDRKGETVRGFYFYPSSTDFVILALESGIYMVEIDDRAWQNMQPIMRGEGLDVRVENGQVHVFDGTLIYQMIFDV